MTTLTRKNKIHPGVTVAQTLADIRTLLAVRPLTIADIMEHTGHSHAHVTYVLKILRRREEVELDRVLGWRLLQKDVA